MNCAIQVSDEALINYMLLKMMHLDEYDENLYLGNNVNVLKEEDLKEIESYLKVEKVGEPVSFVIERAIEKSSVEISQYSLPAKLKKVNRKK